MTQPFLFTSRDRRCTVCHRVFPLSEFHASNKAKDKTVPTCKECTVAINRRRKQKRKVNGKELAYYRKTKKRRKELALPRQRGITIEDYARMFAAQEGLCAICGRPEQAKGCKGTPKDLAIDHCHTTSRVRGLLCTPCNQGLGCFRDNVALLQKAIDYLLARGS